MNNIIIFDLQLFSVLDESDFVMDAYNNEWTSQSLYYKGSDISIENENTNKKLYAFIGTEKYGYASVITVGDYTKSIENKIFKTLYTYTFDVLYNDPIPCTAFWKNQNLIEHIIQDNLGLPFSLISINPINFKLPDVITLTYATSDNTYYVRSFCILGSESDCNVVNYVTEVKIAYHRVGGLYIIKIRREVRLAPLSLSSSFI